MTADKNRGVLMVTSMKLLDWLVRRRAPFRAHDLALELEVCQRTAHRWLASAEILGWAERDPNQSDFNRPSWRSRLYKSRCTCQQQAPKPRRQYTSSKEIHSWEQ